MLYNILNFFGINGRDFIFNDIKKETGEEIENIFFNSFDNKINILISSKSKKEIKSLETKINRIGLIHGFNRFKIIEV